MLSASVMYPIRGAVTWKSTAGTNVASDALANLASGGVTGGALIIIGEDYGEGSSIMQERSHAFAMKSQIWLLDPRPNLPIHRRRRSRTASNCRRRRTRRSCSRCASAPATSTASFVAKDNKRPDLHAAPRRWKIRGATSTASCCRRPPIMHEKEKIEKRWPAAVEFIKERKLNEFFGADDGEVGIILQGGMYNGVMRALQQLGLADVYGNTARSALRAERHLSADRRRGRRVLPSASTRC